MEDLEAMLGTVHDYVERVAANTTDNTQQADRSNPGKGEVAVVLLAERFMAFYASSNTERSFIGILSHL